MRKALSLAVKLTGTLLLGACAAHVGPRGVSFAVGGGGSPYPYGSAMPVYGGGGQTVVMHRRVVVVRHGSGPVYEPLYTFPTQQARGTCPVGYRGPAYC